MTNELSLSRIEELKVAYCDSYKDVHGIKARWVFGQDLTEEQLLKMLSQLEKEWLVVSEREKQREKQASKEAMERIQLLINCGAKDVAMAIRWLHEAHGTGGDNSFLDYELGTEYGFVNNLLKTCV